MVKGDVSRCRSNDTVTRSATTTNQRITTTKRCISTTTTTSRNDHSFFMLSLSLLLLQLMISIFLETTTKTTAILVHGFTTTTTTTTMPSFGYLQRQKCPKQRSKIPFLSSTSTRDLSMSSSSSSSTNEMNDAKQQPRQQEYDDDNVVDIAIIGAGIGGLCAGAILNTLYGKKVGVYESHYLPGGCAHAFQRKAPSPNGMTFTFDSGPTILLGCSAPPFSALRQVLNAIDQKVEWIRYDGWGMIENPKGTINSNNNNNNKKGEIRWKCQLGPNYFQQGPLTQFSTTVTTMSKEDIITEFENLRKACKPLIVGSGISAMAMRPGPSALIPILFKYTSTLFPLLSRSAELTGTFDSYINGPKFVVQNVWLRNWLDALAFSLSGLPASRTSAAAMAFVLEDMHREDASLDYPQGGLGSVIDALVQGLESGTNGSKLYLKSHVQQIDFEQEQQQDGKNDNNQKLRAVGITLQNGTKIRAKQGVICNAPIWSLRNLIQHDPKAQLVLNNGIPYNTNDNNKKNYDDIPQSWMTTKEEGSSIHLTRPTKKNTDVNNNDSNNGGLLDQFDDTEMTGSFLHLHVAINATGLDLSKMEAHYTVMDRGLSGDDSDNAIVNGIPDGPCGELNMIALSNPCVIDPTLAPPGYMVLHAYGAGNEPYDIWKEKNDHNDNEEETNNDNTEASSSPSLLSRNKKNRRQTYEDFKEQRAKVLWRAMESIIPDIHDRVVLSMIGSPKTHERFLRRPKGTYGAATEDYLQDGKTPIDNLILAGDSIFPGIGVPSVAISGASAANAFVSPWEQLQCLNALQRQGKL